MVKTEVVDCFGSYLGKLQKASDLIKKDCVVAFRTETVYGLGANAYSDKAVTEVFRVKGRPADNPLIVHVSGLRHCEEVIGKKLQGIRLRLAQRFWPGPLSIIFEDDNFCSDAKLGAFGFSCKVTCGLNSAAIRVPDCELARDLIGMCELPIAAPSANKSTKPSPTMAEHVFSDFAGEIPMILDGGSCKIGLESTVLLIEDTKKPKILILREGGISREDIIRFIGNEAEVICKTCTFKENIPDKPLCPGTKYRHYAPKTPLTLVDGSEEFFVEYLRNNSSKNIGVLCSDELCLHIERLKTITSERRNRIFRMGSRNHLEDVASNLFKSMRQIDKEGFDLILCEVFPREGIGAAVMNRLEKASGNKVVREKVD